MNEKNIDELSAMVESVCQSKTNLFGYGIWTHHIVPMVKLARELAPEYGADAEIVVISALLRGLSDGKGGESGTGGSPSGMALAEDFLAKRGYPREVIERIKGYSSCRGTDAGKGERSMEEACVADADAMSHIQEIGSLFYVVYKEMNLDIDEGIRWIQGKIARDWEAMSGLGREKFRLRYEQIQNDIIAINGRKGET